MMLVLTPSVSEEEVEKKVKPSGGMPNNQRKEKRTKTHNTGECNPLGRLGM